MRAPLYHAGAAIASNYLVTLYRAASRPSRRWRAARSARPADDAYHRERLRADRPDRARATGTTVDAHLARDPRERPSSSRCIAPSRRRPAVKTRPHRWRSCGAARPDDVVVARADDGRAPRRSRLAAARRARGMRPVVVPASSSTRTQFSRPEPISPRYPARRSARRRARRRGRRRRAVRARRSTEIYPPGYQTWVDVEELSRPLEGEFRPGHFRGVATVCLKLFNIVRPHARTSARRTRSRLAVLRRMIRDLILDLELRVLPTSSPRATLPMPNTRCSAGVSASNTGPTRSTRDLPRPEDARRGPALRRDSVLLLRPVRPRDGVRRLRDRVGRSRLPRRPEGARVHRVLDRAAGGCSPG